jgi:aryl-alcohol dehydrogenase-like predicted oxidoreductase
VKHIQCRSVGSTGVAISRIGLGGYELGPEPAEEPDVKRATRVVDAAIESGVNWLDTSENYLATHNEEVIGAALQDASGEFLVASKVAPGAGVTGGGSGFRREQVQHACQDSLKRLRRDHLDIYFLHGPDRTGVPLEETWGAMAELAQAGLVRAIGLSNYDIEDVERCHRERPVDAVQVGLSLIDYLDARAYIARCETLEISATVFEPLASGILSGKTMEQVQGTWTGPWRDSPFYKRLLGPGNAEKSFAVADGLRPIAEELDATVAQLALAWVLHQTGVTAAIAGSRSEMHTRENAEAGRLTLSSEILDQIEQLIPLGPTVATLAGS